MVGLSGIVIAALAIGGGWISVWWVALPLVVFLVLAMIHEGVERKRDRAARAVAHYEKALGRLSGSWMGAGNLGEEYQPPSHIYADDLDLFGRGSLFELLDTARTRGGERKLAEWLLAPGSVEDVLARQDAVEELKPYLNLREEIALLGTDTRMALDRRVMAEWGAMPAARIFNGAAWVALMLALAFVVTFLLFLAQKLSLWPVLLVVLLETIFSFAIRDAVNRVVAGVAAAASDLALLGHFLERLEGETFRSPRLQEIARGMSAPTEASASAEIRALENWVDRLDWARNQFFLALSLPLLWIPQCAIAMEAWRARSGAHIAEWMAAVAEFEALSCLASFAYEHPHAVFPELLEQGAVFSGRQVRHPLIPAGSAIANDVELNPVCPLWVISGSNMSGKSTLLRAVGMNTVLAWAGAPVCCQSLQVSRLRIGASIRVNDSLADNKSRFYAEITRLRSVVDLAKQGEPTLFLLDELLSGTNSHDRRIGAAAVVRGLVERGAIGLVTTHDLALADIADGLGEQARNLHFEDQMEAGEMYFDYRLKPGVVQRSNALELMRAVGLDV